MKQRFWSGHLCSARHTWHVAVIGLAAEVQDQSTEYVEALPKQVVGYGHLGDGNLHLNVSCAQYEAAILDRIEPYVYEWTAARRGSISAEHGLGQMKAECIGCDFLLPGHEFP